MYTLKQIHQYLESQDNLLDAIFYLNEENLNKFVLLPIESNSCNCKEQTELHSCPYQSEINGNDDLFCTCCAYCQHECSMDI